MFKKCPNICFSKTFFVISATCISPIFHFLSTLFSFSLLFQLKRYNDALEAAFTYYVHHPNNEVAESNVQYYMQSLNIDMENVKNAESYVSITFLDKVGLMSSFEPLNFFKKS